MDGTQFTIKLDISSQDKIIDFDVGNFSGLKMHDQLKQIISLNFSFQSVKKMPILLQNQTFESQMLFEIAFFSKSSIQIIAKDILNPLSLNKKIIENFNLPFPTPISQVNQLIQVFSPPILTSCHQNGDFIFYDTSRPTRIQLIQRKNFNNQACVQMERFFNNKIIALTSLQVLLIDPSQQIVNNSLNNLTNIIQITSNYDKLAINYNNCIQIFSTEFISIFVQCSNNFSSNNLNIALNNDLKLITQKIQAIFIYQLNLTDQSASLVYSLSQTSNIQFVNFFKQFISDQSNTLNSYVIEEIILFDSLSNLSFYNISLLQTCTPFNLNVKSILQVKRVLNDNSAYFIAGIDILSGLYDMILILKNSNQQFLINSAPFKPSIEQPFKKINGKGNIFYSYKYKFNLNFFSLLKEYEIDPNRNITYIYGHDYLYGDYATYPLNNIESSSSTLLCRYGSQSGLIYIAKFNQYRYTEISTKQMLSSSDATDQIIEIIQSAYLGVYFVRTIKKITSYNLFTNDFIEELTPTIPTNQSFSQISLVQGTLSVICWSQQQVLLVNYEQTSSQKYYFSNMSLINGWLYDSNQNVFYIYGSSFSKLDPSLKILNSIFQLNLTKVQFLQCQMTNNLIICSVSLNSFVIMNKTSLDNSQIQIVQVNGFTSQFQIFLDEQYQNIFLFSSIISIYNFNGVFNTTYSLKTQLTSCSIQQGFLLFSSQQFIYFIYRDTLQLRQNFISGPSGLNIINYIYVDYLQQIILYANQYLFAQIYIYDSQTLQNIAKINGSFAQNQIGYVVQMYFDPFSTTLLYLDTQGNLYVMFPYQSNSIQNNYKITEIIDRNEQLVSFSFDKVTNNLIVYSTSAVYQINYSTAGNQYEAQLNEPANLFSTIPLNSQLLDFLIFNTDNTIFRYSKFHISYETVLEGSQIVDIMYNCQSDILVIAQKNAVLFYQQYQYSKDNQQISNIFSIQEIQFNKFILSNVYLTLDKKVIHCDLKTGLIIRTFQLQSSVLVTQFQSNKNQDLIFFGLSDGQVLQYNLSDQSVFYYPVSDASFNTSIINIILDESKKPQQQAFFVSNGGILIQVDFVINKIISKINLINLVNEESEIQLVDFLVDLISNSQFIFSPQTGTQNDLQLQNNTFSILKQQILQIFNYNFVFKNQHLIMIQNTFIVLYQINYKNNSGSFQLSQQQTISIQSSNFSFNQAQNGGALFFLGILQSVSFINSQFIGNSATSSGGAFYFADIGNCQIIFDSNSKVSKNKALIGGGLRIIQSSSMNFKFPKNFPFQKNIFQNEAEIYGNDSTTYPQQLQLQNVQGQSKQNMYQFNFQESTNFIPQAYQSQFSRYAHIKDFQSGGQLILRIFVLDNYNRSLSFSQEKLLGELYPSDIQQELKDIYISINNLDVQLSQLIGQRILDYNQYNSTSQAFELTSLQILAQLQSNQLFVISSSIYTKSEESYPVLLSIYFRQCQLGEIIQSVTNDIMICKYCQEQTYSLIDPQVLFKQQLDQSNLIKNECNTCPPSASSCQGASINLKNGYWRSNNFTDQILSCDPQIGSCKGEDPNSINYCSVGYIGPLCQQCDITGEIWQGARYQEAIMKGFCEQCAGIYFQYAFLTLKFSIMNFENFTNLQKFNQ
ncbi:hypothetical protein TTHERM_00364260 (macronuclear) [Tetrahymena thermophila SB210]|uniref:Transmembrane protein n=1 Tax=Tetrahymena thermophila (strain SB210) TaxID=312017 RepID=Q22PB6_TETTS|nr:hypothetical protein TTHERM_00364260 [Tetrahymena thermophila SB210]EAR87193.2 hypothetical protein TTHERM_00364260 [Tetrahymena thermophila SB210]|eukprot:XP_001007438.2 hypothetical protein TTHERM_00364260 [Tetrahymena thermophila SB210]